MKISETKHRKTELRSQLESATEANVRYGIDALRFLISGFVQYKQQRQWSGAQAASSNFYYG